MWHALSCNPPSLSVHTPTHVADKLPWCVSAVGNLQHSDTGQQVMRPPPPEPVSFHLHKSHTHQRQRGAMAPLPCHWRLQAKWSAWTCSSLADRRYRIPLILSIHLQKLIDVHFCRCMCFGVDDWKNYPIAFKPRWKAMNSETAQSTHHSDSVLRINDVCSMLGLSRSTIYGKINPASSQYDATFPRPFKIGAMAVAWSRIEISNWLQNMKEKGTNWIFKTRQKHVFFLSRQAKIFSFDRFN